MQTCTFVDSLVNCGSLTMHAIALHRLLEDEIFGHHTRIKQFEIILVSHQ